MVSTIISWITKSSPAVANSTNSSNAKKCSGAVIGMEHCDKRSKRGLESGKWVLLEIDVQGALAVMQQCENTISLFVHPGSPEELERRLRARGTETEASIQRRLQVAADEMKFAHRYDYIVVNEEVSRTVQQICQLLRQSTSQETKNNA